MIWILIKDNHLAALRHERPNAIDAAVRRARAAYPQLKVEVEADTLEQVDQALAAGADFILLDNMDLDQLRQAVRNCAGRVPTEASGGVNLDTVGAIAKTGVNFISVGALTHSARAVDIGLDFEARVIMSIDVQILNALRSAAAGSVSGSELSQNLRVSRAAVWARIEELRSLGYDIEASPHHGYRLLAAPDVLHADDLVSRLGPTRVIGRDIRVFKSTVSTNDVVEKLARDGVKEGAVVFAESQTRRPRAPRTQVAIPRPEGPLVFGPAQAQSAPAGEHPHHRGLRHRPAPRPSLPHRVGSRNQMAQ